MTKEGLHEWYKYVYNDYLDIVICPEYKSLKYSTTNREGYREYKSLNYQCETCCTKYFCTESKNCQKTVTKHIWEDYIEWAKDIRHSPSEKESHKLSSKPSNGHADAKKKYGMRYTPYREPEQISKWIRLNFAAMNLKKPVMRRRKNFMLSRKIGNNAI